MFIVLGADKKEYGPVGAEEIRRWITDHRLEAASLVRLDGSADWKPLSSFPEFADALAAAPALPLPPASEPPVPRTSNAPALIGLILGMVSVPFSFLCCGPVLSIPGIIVSAVGLGQINKSQGQQTGKGLAVAGLVLSIVALIVTIVIFLIFGLFSLWGQ